MNNVKHKAACAALTGSILVFYGMAYAQDLPTAVSGDLLTNSSQTTPWQNCKGSDLVDAADPMGFNAADLEDEGCAYRETPAEAGKTYRFTCGISSFKYSSMTLAFQDANSNELATETTEIFEDVQGGAYSVTLTAPPNTTSAAVGIYGLHSSGFHDCSLMLQGGIMELPATGTISGSTWFDQNGNSSRQDDEGFLAGITVSLWSNGNMLDTATTTAANTGYSFSGLDLDVCYVLQFGEYDPTVAFSAQANVSAAGPDGRTGSACFTGGNENLRIHVGYAPVPPAEPPSDYAICGVTLREDEAGNRHRLGGATVELYRNGNEFIERQTTDIGNGGAFGFSSLPAGSYRLKFTGPSGYDPIVRGPVLMGNTGFNQANGYSPTFSIPQDGNTPDSNACTLIWANGIFQQKPVALPPTQANDDVFFRDVARDAQGGPVYTQDGAFAWELPVTENDSVCGTVESVEIISTNSHVDGWFTSIEWDPARQAIVMESLTGYLGGRPEFTYGVRSSCGTYDTADVVVQVADENVAQTVHSAWSCGVFRLGADGTITHGIRMQSNDSQIFVGYPEYRVYNRSGNLIKVLDRSNEPDYFIQSTTMGVREWYLSNNHGFNIRDVHAVSAVTNAGNEGPRKVCAELPVSPIAIDIDASGDVERIKGEFRFDHDADGITDELLEWFGPDEGILIGNYKEGTITGEHLFGDQGGLFSDGFAKLALLDKNNDGELTGDELQTLQLWTDRNSNALLDEGELSDLQDHKIVGLPVTHFQYAARAKLESGDTLIMRDLWLQKRSHVQASANH